MSAASTDSYRTFVDYRCSFLGDLVLEVFSWRPGAFSRQLRPKGDGAAAVECFDRIRDSIRKTVLHGKWLSNRRAVGTVLRG